MEPGLRAFNTGSSDIILGNMKADSINFKIFFKIDPVLTAMIRQCSIKCCSAGS